jgi:hypothetical protein
MTIRELAELVQRTRDAQRKYFRTRTGLEESMALEREIDSAVRDILDPGLF